MKKLIKEMLLTCAIVMSLGTQAKALTVFTDRSPFLAALSNATIIDFEEIAVGPDDSVPVVGDPWFVDGVVFDEAGVGDNMAVGGGGGQNNNIFALGGEDADIDITLTDPVVAFGLEIFSNNRQSSNERLIFFNLNDIVLADIEMPFSGPTAGAFVGLIGDIPEIKRIAFIEDVDGDYVGIGEVVFTSTVPEPGSLILLGSGLIGLIGLKKKWA